MIQVEITVDALEPFIAHLRELIENIDTDPFLEDAGSFLLNRIRTRFLAEQGPEGEGWKPSKAALKRRDKGGSGTLFDSGNLFRSIQFAITGPDQAAIGTDVEYAPYMHYGFKHWKDGSQVGPWPFMAVSDDDARVLETILIKRIESILGNIKGE